MSGSFNRNVRNKDLKINILINFREILMMKALDLKLPKRTISLEN